MLFNTFTTLRHLKHDSESKQIVQRGLQLHTESRQAAVSPTKPAILNNMSQEVVNKNPLQKKKNLYLFHMIPTLGRPAGPLHFIQMNSVILEASLV